MRQFTSRKFVLFFIVFTFGATVSTIALFMTNKMSGETWLATLTLLSGLAISYGLINVKQKKQSVPVTQNLIVQGDYDLKNVVK